MIRFVGLDADDTLWHHERYFRATQAQFLALLADHADPDHLEERLLAAERRNLGHYGYGVKGFVLSMIETAIEVTDGRVPAGVIATLLASGRDMLAHPIDLLPHAEATVRALAGQVRLVLVTKGDLLDQERKLAASGLGDFFDGVEIVSSKTAPVYAAIFARHGALAEHAMMVGNSLHSDVIPPIAAGAWGVHVPHGLTWALEDALPPAEALRFRTLAHLGDLLPLLENLAAGTKRRTTPS